MANTAGSLRVAVGGLGAIGMPVARALDDGIAGLRLAAVSAHDQHRAAERILNFRRPVPVLPLAHLAGVADVVVECVPGRLFGEIAEPAVAKGRILLALSAGALLMREDLIELAEASGARILVPSGALGALDAVRAAAQGEIHSVRLITRKPPDGLKRAPHVEAERIDLDGLAEPMRLFAGSAREAALGFPANLNVAAALSLAGVGADRTEVEIWADPTLQRNCHRVEVDAAASRFAFEIEGVPSPDNPRTGALTPLSVLACLRGLTQALRVGG